MSLVVPVLYTEPQLRTTLRELSGLRDRLDLEMVVVVDVPEGSRLGEVQAENDRIAAEVNAMTIYRVGERGFGSALRRGFAEAAGDAVIPIMGDASEVPEDVVRLARALENGCDVVAGSRYMRGGRIVGNTTKQRISRLYSVLVRLAGGPPIHDISNAFKAYRRSVIESVETVSDSFDISVELTLKAALAGFRICEVPTLWKNREQGTSHFVFWREVRNYGRWLILAARTRGRGGRSTERRSVSGGSG